jgi:hypothetical protein
VKRGVVGGERGSRDDERDDEVGALPERKSALAGRDHRSPRDASFTAHHVR